MYKAFLCLAEYPAILPAARGYTQVVNALWAVPAMTITDRPRFSYRGLMVDVSRFFTPKENLLRIIDCMAMLKLNKLHLHLTDDNGWRIEIKRYPLLTEIGSRRVERPGARRSFCPSMPVRENPRWRKAFIRRMIFGRLYLMPWHAISK